MHFDLLFEWILNWVKVAPPLGDLGLQQRCLILLMMIHIMQNITVKPICPYIGVVVFSIIIHNIKTIPEVSMHLCKFWAKVTPFYGMSKKFWKYMPCCTVPPYKISAYYAYDYSYMYITILPLSLGKVSTSSILL